MATQRIANTESSVLFNLRQLMQLEHERVESELEAAREAAAEVERVREAAEQARMEEQRRAEREAARVVRECEAERERMEREREEALLRVRLEAEAGERRASEELALLHARDMQHVQLAARRKRGWMLGATLVAAAIAASGVHALLRARPAEVVTVAPRVQAAGLLADQARELARLRELVAHLSQARAEPAAAVVAVPAAEHTRKLPSARPKPRVPRGTTHREDNSLDDLDDASNDPILDM